MQQKLGFLTRLWLKLSSLTLAAGAILRAVLIFNPLTEERGFGFADLLQIFGLGAVNDLCVATIGFGAVWIFAMLCTAEKYKRPTGYAILAILTVAFVYVTFFNTILDEYGSVVPLIGSSLSGYILLTFALRMFIPGLRERWLRVSFALLLGGGVAAVVFNSVSEYIFWSEFGVRYNFIAVDYLVYTNEVVGNIMESYPIIPMALALLAVTAALTWLIFRKDIGSAGEFEGWRWKGVAAPAYLAAAACAVGLLLFNTRFQHNGNVYVNELQANGCHKFCDAFVKNELNFKQFYLTMDDAEAEAFICGRYGSGEGNIRTVVNEGEELHPNIVLITVESMSASFMERFGGPQGLTPTLDSLYRLGIAFDRIYATGNRTVRGLEAVTLSLPPCAGQSIVKRKDCGGRATTGGILREKGYTTTYFYGGDAYFDNMSAFFGGNGYEIVDRSCYSADEITFANIWGVCDEDAYRKVLSTLDRRAGTDGQPFFAHIMTVSNHRPFTYPEGRVEIPATAKSRWGGVQYSDYALGEFFREAAARDWFANTVFLITADHCASSAGKTEIPLDKYHIPALIFAPSMFGPQSIGKTASQIDLVPTLLALLGMDYESRMYGENILSDDFAERAFIATYQDLGYLEGDRLTVLSPVRRAVQLAVRPTEENPYNTEPAIECDEGCLRRAVAYYQTAAAWN